MKKLALFGVTGKKSGGAFLRLLNAHQNEVETAFPDGIRVLVRESSDTSDIDNAPIPYEKYVGSATDPLHLLQAFDGVDTVINIAGIGFFRRIADAAAECHVRRLIVVHTTGIYSKYNKAGEIYRNIDSYVTEVCRKNGIVLTILRPTMIYGNRFDNNIISFIRMVDKFPLMPVVNGARYGLQPVHYGDLATAYYQVLMNEEVTANRNFDLSGGDEITLRDILIEIGKNLGKKTRFLYIPYFLASLAAWLLYLLTLKRKDFREKVQRLCEPRVYSHKDATEAFGYAPRSFSDGIVDEVEEYKQSKA